VSEEDAFSCDIDCGSAPPPSSGGGGGSSGGSSSIANATNVTCRDEMLAMGTCIVNTLSVEAEVDCENCMLDAFNAAYPALEASDLGCDDWNAYMCAVVPACPCLSGCLDEYNPLYECDVRQQLALLNVTFSCDINCGSTPPPPSGSSNSTGPGNGSASSGGEGGGSGTPSGSSQAPSGAGTTTATTTLSAILAAAAGSIALFA
jgi:hypothetical protein